MTNQTDDRKEFLRKWNNGDFSNTDENTDRRIRDEKLIWNWHQAKMKEAMFEQECRIRQECNSTGSESTRILVNSLLQKRRKEMIEDLKRTEYLTHELATNKGVRLIETISEIKNIQLKYQEE